ncbi:hypothetical protein [Desulfovibrio gilichinskyi]|uniref:Lipoprotein n=1 Tax=Desulfovibrio gilichinskyi TaxID=1519643 RepID=A0A1X7EGV4_9BACT|nr:hypothetical protein [Desulfovibrio gilichinskyi]SMF33785.1 hypothetical protein SAMN06295933_2926 [Desulfovibrio gilichinskyi]
MFRKITLLCVFMIVAIMLGCYKTLPSRYQKTAYDKHYQHKIASTHASVLTVIPWDEIKDELQPDFKMDSAKAFDLAIPTTFAEDKLILKAISAYLKAGLTGALSSTTATSLKGSEVADSFSESKTKSFTQPDISGLNINHNEAGLMSTPENKELESTIINPRLRYSAATALYQEVKLLNKYVKYAAKRDGYTPYLVRMQVSLNPKTHNAPYDAYSTISFFPDRFSHSTCEKFGQNNTEMRTPYVIPLLATEDLESSSYNRTNEKILQLGMALMATINGIGAEAGFSSTAKNFLKTTGKNYNSLMTVGRISDNSIRVRFGAMLTANEKGTAKEYVMIPRTHYVTLLLMVPNGQNNKLMAVARTNLVNINTGKDLMWTEKSTMISEAALILEKYEIPFPEYINHDSHTDKKVATNFIKLAADVQTNRWDCFDTDYDTFCESLGSATEKKDNATIRCKAAKLIKEQIWTDIANLWIGGQYSYTSFQVKSNIEHKEVEATLPSSQFVFPAIDDGTRTNVFVAGGNNISKKNIKPLLIAFVNKKKLTFPPLAIAGTTDGTGCNISFQSFKDIKGFSSAKMELSFAGRNQKNIVLYQMTGKESSAKCSFEIHSTMNNIVTEKGHGNLQVVFSGVKTGGATCLMKVQNGAVGDSVLKQNGFVLDKKYPGWRTVPRDGLVTIPLYDLNAGTNVIVEIKAMRGEEVVATGLVTAAPVILTVKKEK